MNIQSEVEYFTDLGQIDKARFVTRIVCEIGDEAKLGPADGTESSRLKFANEITLRLVRFTYQLLSEDPARPQDDIMIRMLLAARTDKQAERIIRNAYRRVLNSFESFDTTVLLNGH